MPGVTRQPDNDPKPPTPNKPPEPRPHPHPHARPHLSAVRLGEIGAKFHAAMQADVPLTELQVIERLLALLNAEG